MTAADTISKFLQRGTGMNPDIALVRANHLLDDLNRAGYVIVPKEPTNEMICAALDAWDHGKRGYTDQWSVMVQAGTE